MSWDKFAYSSLLILLLLRNQRAAWFSLCFVRVFSDHVLAMEEILFELGGVDVNEQGLPPGFRFHPTDEELITFYLASKVLNESGCGVDIAEVDLNRCEPWELPDAAKMGEREWYFFSLRDRKYPTGLRTNRATCAGYWKATGKDREVYSSSPSGGALVGMKKTLVFYKGRAPRGDKTKWVMHEYRLDSDFIHRHSCREEWVICRIFHKIGEKKNLLLQGESHLNLVKGCSPTSAGLLPPLIEASTTLVEVQSQQESYLKSLINPIFSRFNLLPLTGNSPSFPPTTNIMTTGRTTTTKDEDADVTNAASKLCKTEASFPYCQSSNDDMPGADKTRQIITDQSRTPAPPPSESFWADFMGFPTAPDSVGETHLSSALVGFNRASFQMLSDPSPITDAWPQDF